jgi:hypothetical protein
MGPSRPESQWIDQTPPRAFFAELVTEAVSETDPAPSAFAQAYLVDLLAGRVVAPAEPAAEAPLAEAWYRAQQAERSEQIHHLRGLGDRALFVSGFFGESLVRSVVGPGYYRDMGRRAYGALAGVLGAVTGEDSWPALYGELADRFPALAGVLADVSDRAYGCRDDALLTAYDTYVTTGSRRARRRLLRAGISLAHPHRKPQ